MPHDHITSHICASPESERWLPIDGWPGYEVSDIGRQRTLKQRFRDPAAKSKKKRPPGHVRRNQWIIGTTPTIMTPSVHHRSGHLQVMLSRPMPGGGHESRQVRVHTLVLEAFVGPCPPGMEACHFPDRDPANNRLDNLRWDTPKANRLDMLHHGTHRKAKLFEPDIPVIRERLMNGESQVAVAKDYGVATSTIGAVWTGETWSHIPWGGTA